MATTTASQAKQNSVASKKRKKARKGVLFEAHKHCVECSIPIPLSNDSMICDDENCRINQEKKEKSRKRLSILLYVGVGIFIIPIAIQLIGALT
jgi:predicted nucleic acid-binding Zn ribbon protein